MNLEWAFHLTPASGGVLIGADAVLLLVLAAAMIAGMARYRLMPSKPNQMPS
jgi:hypothetical protein